MRPLDFGLPEAGNFDYHLLAETAPDPAPNAFDLIARDDERRYIRRLLGRLDPRLQRVILLRFGIIDDNAHTLEAVAQKMYLSKERIRQLQSEAFNQLRSFLEEAA